MGDTERCLGPACDQLAQSRCRAIGFRALGLTARSVAGFRCIKSNEADSAPLPAYGVAVDHGRSAIDEAALPVCRVAANKRPVKWHKSGDDDAHRHSGAQRPPLVGA
jgi:hypothetical protein